MTPSVASIVANACAYYGVTVAQLRAHSRVQPLCGARQEAMAACVMTGHTLTETGRFFNLRHNAAIHAHDVVLADPERLVRARCFAGSGTVGELPAIAASYLAAAPTDLAAMLAYVNTALLGMRPAPGPQCAYGLMLLANPAYQAGMTRALTACGFAEQAPRITDHLKALGYARRAA